MKVVHVIPREGAAYRLHVGLRRLGVASQMLVVERTTDDPDVVTFHPPGDALSRARRRVRRERIRRSAARYQATRPPGCGYFFDDRTPHGADVLPQVPSCDVVHLHTMTDLVDFRGFFPAVPRRVPVVRTLHDMTFFTGGCHHDWGCGKYTRACGACPQLGSRVDGDLSRQIWERKRAALRAVPPSRLQLVAPSRWLAATARASTLLRAFPITVIPSGLDTEVFRPRDRACARDALGIAHDARVALFVGDPVERPEKGFVLLARALEAVREVPDLLLVSAGSGRAPCPVSVPHVRLGRVGSEWVLSLAYSAADICVIPSVQDNFPYAALESLACGTPVVAFAVGGIPEIVRPGVTGLLAPPRDVGALGAAIHELLRQPARRAEMAAQCRRVAVDEYRLDLQAQRYLALYERILEDARQEGRERAAGAPCDPATGAARAGAGASPAAAASPAAPGAERARAP